MERKKYTISCVSEAFEKEGYKLLSDMYKNGKQKLEYICPKGHRHNISFGKWVENRRCPYCDGQGKPTIEFIRSQFENINYILLTDIYINSWQKLEYICSNDHECKISWHSWQLGRRCHYCSMLDKIEASFKNEGYIVLSISNFSCRSRITYKCPFGHEYSVNWANWNSRKNRCPTCEYMKRCGPGHPNWKGGISCEPYCDAWADKEYKESIKERDNYECQNPDCWKTDNKLILHHVDYVKKNCSPSNLITICNSCNSRANFNRNYWTKFYQKIMKKRGFS